MSRLQKRVSAGMVGLVLVVCTAAFVAARSASSPTREVTLVARGMRFVLADAPGASNPPIRIAAGERVRLTLRNETPGIAHDLTVPAWGVELPMVRTGEEASVTFIVPDGGGAVDYFCRPHAQMMRGRIGVAAQ